MSDYRVRARFVARFDSILDCGCDGIEGETLIYLLDDGDLVCEFCFNRESEINGGRDE